MKRVTKWIYRVVYDEYRDCCWTEVIASSAKEARKCVLDYNARIGNPIHVGIVRRVKIATTKDMQKGDRCVERKQT